VVSTAIAGLQSSTVYLSTTEQAMLSLEGSRLRNVVNGNWRFSTSHALIEARNWQLSEDWRN
jgi:hypothetical protein